MKTLTTKLPTIALLIAVFAVSVIFAPTTAEAKWVDRSGELPGMDLDLTPFLIAGGVLVGGLIIYKLAKSGSDASDEESFTPTEAMSTDDENAISEETEVEADDTTDYESTSIMIPQEDSKLGVFFNVTDDRRLYNAEKKTLDFSDLTVRAGFTIGF